MNLEQEYSIKKETIYTLGEFSILWCYFEQRKFGAETSPSKMIEWAE
ncbi:hypothetical protein [Pectinatus brassicae]|uniref:Uncharacterized protein n=1 Tax=Pectinatus brassicae TaxID=862415 RepID=A0A840UN52_9FIRM|nr:hypothetical protein [Pectinatus brassicae]MBB5336118.1 hypothetical protein [Pectinatus brassicae]